MSQDFAHVSDFTGPVSSTDNAIARYDGTTGMFVQNSGATIDDNGLISSTAMSGAYTPTVGDEFNVASHSGEVAFWTRIGNIVQVDGGIILTATAGSEVDFSLTLPVASTLAGNTCRGNICGCKTSDGTTGTVGTIYQTGNKAFIVLACGSTAAISYGFSFSYIVA